MQESRLFKILYYLLNKGSATASELAERFEISVRTIYRDIDALSSAGIPVYTESGRNGGIRLLTNFVLEHSIISEQDRKEILSALQGLASISGEQKKDTLEKFSALFHSHAVNWLEVDFSRWGEKPRDNEKFQTLKTAIIHCQCIKIYYTDSCQKTISRVIEPLKLYYKSKDWYIKAFCRLRQDFRLFKLNRILKWELLEETFTPHPFPETQNEGQNKDCGITLRFRERLSSVFVNFSSIF